MNEHIASMYDPFHPAIIRLLKNTVEAALRNGIGISVCGELAGDPRALPLWLGLGVRQLSMNVQSILPVKNSLLESRAADCKKMAEKLLACRTSEEVRKLLADVRRDEKCTNELYL